MITIKVSGEHRQDGSTTITTMIYRFLKDAVGFENVELDVELDEGFSDEGSIKNKFKRMALKKEMPSKLDLSRELNVIDYINSNLSVEQQKALKY